MNATLTKALTVYGIEFDAECEFSFTHNEGATDYVPYGEGSVAMPSGASIDDIEPEQWLVNCADLREGVWDYIRNRFPCLQPSQVTELTPRIIKRIVAKLDKANPFDYACEDDFEERAWDSL